MASKKQDLHSILEGMNVAHRKDMKDVIVGHLNENGILKKEWDLPKSDQIKPKWSTSMRKPLRSPTKGAEKEKLPPINQTVRLMTDAVAEFSLGNKTYFSGKRRDLKIKTSPSFSSISDDLSLSNHLLSATMLPNFSKDTETSFDKVFVTNPDLAPTKRRQYKEKRKLQENVIKGKRETRQEPEIRKAIQNIEFNIARKLEKLSKTHDVSTPSYFKWKIYSEAWDELIDSSETWREELSRIKEGYDVYINTLLDAQANEQGPGGDKVELLSLNQVDRRSLARKSKRIKELETEITKQLEINSRLQEKLRNVPTEYSENHIDINEHIKEGRYQNEQTDEDQSPFKQTGIRDLEEEVAMLHGEIEVKLKTLEDLKRDQKKNYVPMAVCERLEHCIKETEVEIQKLCKQNEFLEHNLEELEEELEKVLVKTGIKEEDARMLWQKINVQRLIDLNH